jgi:hypothetical protein
MRRLLLILALCGLVSAPGAYAKGGHSSGGHSKSSSGSKKSGGSHKSKDSDAGDKPVHVKEYTKKDGTVVSAHDRKAPDSGSGSSAGTASSATSTTTKSAVAETTSPSTGAKHTAAYCTSCPRDANGKIIRSRVARETFMSQTGYKHGRPGYVVDHIIPLECGGADYPGNMQWQTVAEAKAKDATEHTCHQ